MHDITTLVFEIFHKDYFSKVLSVIPFWFKSYAGGRGQNRVHYLPSSSGPFKPAVLIGLRKVISL